MFPSLAAGPPDAKDQDFCSKLDKHFLKAKILMRVKVENKKEKKITFSLCPKLGLSLSGDGRNVKSLGMDEDIYNAILHPHAKFGGLNESIPQFNYSMQMPELLAF